MNTVKGLNDFCKKHRISVPSGDKFSLLDFLLEVSKRTVPLAEYRGRVNEVIKKLGNESQEWGGCPNCGTNVHLGLAECPVCGKSLDLAETEPELEANELSDLDPDYSTEKEIEPVDDIDEFEDDDDSGDEDEDVEESEDDDGHEDYEESDDESSDEVDEIDEDDESESDDEDDDEEEIDADESDENDDSDGEQEDDDDDDEFEEDPEPLIGPKKAAAAGKHFLSKKPINRPTTVHAEKFAERKLRRQKLERLIPKFKKDPSLVMKLKYEHLLIMPGLLGFVGKPTSLGSKADIQRWVKNVLKGGLKK